MTDTTPDDVTGHPGAGVHEVVLTAIAHHLGHPAGRATPEEELDLLALPLGDGDAPWQLVEAVETALDIRFPDDFLDGVVTYEDFRTAVRHAVGP